jgi:hypothetical protein
VSMIDANRLLRKRCIRVCSASTIHMKRGMSVSSACRRMARASRLRPTPGPWIGYPIADRHDVHGAEQIELRGMAVYAHQDVQYKRRPAFDPQGALVFQNKCHGRFYRAYCECITMLAPALDVHVVPTERP